MLGILNFVLIMGLIMITSVQSRSEWKEIKRDLQDVMQGSYKMDKNAYVLKDMNQDVDWRFCVYQPAKSYKNTKKIPYHYVDHINPESRLPELITTRDTERCYVSKTYKDHKKDWDALVEYRDRIFKEKGFTDKTPAFDKIEALMADLSANHTGGGEFLQPADVIAKTGWCTGKSAAIVALAHTMGLEARAIIWWGHTTSEIKIDGKWCFCENIFEKKGERFRHLFHSSWMEIAADPYACREITSQLQRSYYSNVLNFFDFLYDYSIGVQWHESTIGSWVWVRLTPYTAKALYPELDTDKFKLRFYDGRYYTGLKSGKTWIWNGMNWDEGYGWDSLRYQEVKQGQGIKKSFYLADIKKVKKISSHITMVKNNTIDLKSTNWYICINGGGKYYLKDMECWWQYSGNVLFHNSPWWRSSDFRGKAPSFIKSQLDEDRMPLIVTGGEEDYIKERMALGWRWHQGTKQENQLCFYLPIKELKANSLNTVELLSDNQGGESFNVRLVDDPVLPPPAPYNDGSK